MENLTIRRAREEDIPEITRIYNYAIEHTTATFDMEPKTSKDRREWFKSHSDAYPLLVATIDDRVVGWGSIRPFGTRKAYRYTVENAIYIDCDMQGKGIGSALLNELIVLATERGYHAIMALIVGGNEASMKLHERFAFERIGVMREVGRKFDKWLDVIVHERILNVEC